MTIPQIAVKMTEQLPNPEELEAMAAKGHELLRRYRTELGQTHQGQFIVVEPVSGNYVLADSLGAAIQKAQEEYPGKLLYGAPITYRKHFSHRGQAPYIPLGMPNSA